MASTGSDEHVAASAVRVNGDTTSVLFAGVLTVTPASAGTVRVARSEEATESFSMSLIEIL